MLLKPLRRVDAGLCEFGFDVPRNELRCVIWNARWRQIGTAAEVSVTSAGGWARFGNDHAWRYVAIVTAAYIVSRGLTKAGVHRQDREDNDRS